MSRLRWKINSTRTLYHDQWVHLRTADVSLPDGRHLDHRMVHSADAAYAVVVDRDRMLMLWRHRFIPDAWGWEVPGGAIEPGEDPMAAAVREAEEETGWRPDGELRPLLTICPTPGLFGTRHHLFRAGSAVYTGPAAHGWESERIAWVPLDEVRGHVTRGDIADATTLVAVLSVLASA